MSKGLNALERLYDNVHRNSQYYETSLCNVDFKIIEKELKDYQEINIKYKLAIEFIDNIADEFDEHDLDELADKIVKIKKALEIVKENFFPYDIEMFKNGKVRIWVGHDKYFDIDKKEYYLLKEVLL